MFNKKNNFVLHHEHERKGLSRKAWIIIGCAVGVIALVVALVLLVPKFLQNGNNGEENQNNTPVTNTEPPVSGIYVSETPTKTVYYVGDTPNYSGLVIGVKRTGDKGFDLTYSENYDELTITGFDSSAPAEKQTITVKYKEFTTTFTVEIKELPPEEGVRLTGIRVDPLPKKTTYKLGETFDYTGGRVVCEYSDGTTEVVRFNNSGVRVSGFTAISTPGEHNITVEYFDDKGGYAKTTFKITMTE